MHILVTLKHVHDPNTPADFLSASVGGALDYHSATSFGLSAYDANAVEEAIRIKEALGGKVTALSVGGAESVAHIRRAIAMGADEGVVVEGATGIDGDPMAIAALIAAAVGRLDPVDLILCGRQSSDTDGGQVHFYLAEALAMVAVSPVVSIAAEGDGALTLDRIAEGGLQRLKVKLPAVVGVSNEINRPRVPGLKGVMQSKKSAVPQWTLADLGIAPPPAGSTRTALAVVERAVIEPELIPPGTAADMGRALADRLQSEGYF